MLILAKDKMTDGFSGVDCIRVDMCVFDVFVDTVFIRIVQEMLSTGTHVKTEESKRFSTLQRAWRRGVSILDITPTVPATRAIDALPGGMFLLFAKMDQVSERFVEVYHFDRPTFASICRKCLEHADATPLPCDLLLLKTVYFMERVFATWDTFPVLNSAVAKVIEPEEPERHGIDDDYLVANLMAVLQLQGLANDETNERTEIVEKECTTRHPYCDFFASICTKSDWHRTTGVHVFEAMCLAYSCASMLVDKFGQTRWRSVDHFYLFDLCRENREDVQQSIQRVIDSKLAFNGTMSCEQLEEMVDISHHRAGSVASTWIGKWLERADAIEMTHSRGTMNELRLRSSVIRANVVDRCVLVEFISANAIASHQKRVVMNDRWKVFIEFSAAEVTPLQLSSTVLSFAPLAQGGVNYYVLWSPCSFEIPRRAFDSTRSRALFLCLDYPTYVTMAFAGATIGVQMNNTLIADHYPRLSTYCHSALATVVGLQSNNVDVVAVSLYTLQHMISRGFAEHCKSWVRDYSAASCRQCLSNLDKLLAIVAPDANFHDVLTSHLVQPYADVREKMSVASFRCTLLSALHAILAGPDYELWIDRVRLASLVRQPIDAAMRKVFEFILDWSAPAGQVAEKSCVNCSVAKCHSLTHSRAKCCRCRKHSGCVPCSECVFRAEIVFEKLGGYVRITGFHSCTYQSILDELFRVSAVDALFGLCPVLDDVTPVRPPINPICEKNFRTQMSMAAYRHVANAAEQEAMTKMHEVLLHLHTNDDAVHLDRRFVVLTILNKLCCIDHEVLLARTRTFESISLLDKSVVRNARDVRNLSQLIVNQTAFPVCPTALVESASVGAYCFESTASDFTLSLHERVFRNVSLDHLLPRALVNMPPLLLTLSLCNSRVE